MPRSGTTQPRTPVPTDSFRIRKLTDRQLIDALRTVASRCGFEKVNVSIPIVRYHANDVMDAKWFENPTIQKALEMDATLIHGANLWVGRGVHVSVNRDPKDPLTDPAALNVPDNNQADAEFVFTVMKAVRDVFGEATVPAWNLDALGADVKAHYEAREQYLARQEREVSGFFTKMADFSRGFTEDHRRKMDQLESDFAERQRKMDEQHQQRMTALNERDAEFEKKKAEFDLQEARGMRRKLRSDQKDELKKLIEKFNLTPETEAKRKPIWFAAVGTIAVLAGVTLYLMFGQPVFDPQGNLNYLLLFRQVAFSLGTVGFVWFFIHWSNRWFQRHADEELRLKRLSLDLDRASWVFEMILDWQKETKQEFPADLLRQLAKNLYTADGVGGDDMTQADLLASLFGAAASLKLKAGGAEVEFDRKSLKTIEKGS